MFVQKALTVIVKLYMQQKIVMSVHISSEKRRTQALKIAAGTTGT